MRYSFCSFARWKMATANPLDDFLNSEVDEYAISALVGSLTNELASPTSKEALQQKSSTNSQKNHVDHDKISGARVTDVQDGQKALNSSVHAGSPITINKTVSDNQLLGLNTIVSVPQVQRAGPNATGGVSIVTVNNNSQQSNRATVSRIGGLQIQTCRGSETADSPGPHSGAGSPAPSSMNSVPGGLLQTIHSVPSPSGVDKKGMSGTPPPVNIVNINRNNNNKAQVVNLRETDAMSVNSNTVPKTQFVIKPQDQAQIPIHVKHENATGSPVSATSTVNVTSKSQPFTVVRTSVTAANPQSISPQVHIMNSPRMTVTSSQLKTLAPRIVNTTPLRIQQQPQMIAPRPGTNTITIPTGMVPQNAVFIKNEQGQIVMVTPSGQGSSTGGVPVSTGGQKVVIKPHGQGSSTIIRPVQSTNTSTATPPTILSGHQRPAIPQTVIHQTTAQGQNAQVQLENVKKCKNFLTTLIKLASSQPKKTVENVKALIQGLIDGRVEPEIFTTKLQIELKSSPQPYLVPFLKKSLPLLRQSLTLGKMTIEGVTAPPLAAARASVPATISHSPVITQTQIPQMPLTPRLPAKAIGVNKTLFKPGMPVTAHHPSPLLHKEKRKYDSLKDDDDINDVATMGGVNLTEESRNILATSSEIFGAQTRSCKDEYFLNTAPLLKRICSIAKKHGLSDVPTEVAHLVSHAAQERLRNLVEKLSTISEHRLELHKMDQRFEATDETRIQLKFLEELDKLEKKRHEDSEREILLRAAKSRSKHEDPEQLKLKQKAKELQQMEMEEVRQREANLTALAAIGPRKKRKTEAADSSPGGSGVVSASGSSSSASQRNTLRPRVKRVNLRDLVFLLEQERESTKSNLLYKTYLK